MTTTETLHAALQQAHDTINFLWAEVGGGTGPCAKCGSTRRRREPSERTRRMVATALESLPRLLHQTGGFVPPVSLTAAEQDALGDEAAIALADPATAKRAIDRLFADGSIK